MYSRLLRAVHPTIFTGSLMAICFVSSTDAAAPLTYPAAMRGTVIDTIHGTPVADPYRWLENLDAPDTRAWVTAQAKLADGYLAACPDRPAIRARLERLANVEKFGVPFHEGGRYFYSHNAGLQNQSVLYTMHALAESPEVALDPNALSADGSLAVIGYVPSHSGQFLAYGVSVSGSDWTDWHVRDLTTGHDLPDVMRWSKYYAPEFAAADAGLYFGAFPAPSAGQELSAQDLGHAVMYHAIGSDPAADRTILQIDGHPDWQYEPHVTRDGRWLVAVVGEGQVGDKGLNNVYLRDLGTSTPVLPLTEGFDAAYIYVGDDGGRLFFLTTLNAPRGRIIAVDLAAPDRAHWAEVVPQGPDAIDLTAPSVALVGHELLVTTLHDAHSRVSRYRVDGQPRGDVAIPGAGTVRGFTGLADDAESFYSYSDLITPSTIYRFECASGSSTLFRAPKIAFDPAQFEVHQVFYPAKDGTQIPMMLAYRKGLALDGTNPTLLYGYGGFGIPVLPTFAPSRIVWLEMGGVYAIANVRGGGEYGEEWHRQAIRTHKQVVFDDFIAGAEWLIARKYTSPPKLAIQGGSNGGLLVGACEVQQPHLYGAVIASVGVMDMLRFDKWGQGAGWVGDYGSPNDPAEFKALRAYSPVHNVKPSTAYPATMIITGDHDTRVMPAHSFKFAAAMQAAQVGKAPVLLRVEMSSGHGGGTTVTQAIDQNADIDAFLARNLGIHVRSLAQ